MAAGKVAGSVKTALKTTKTQTSIFVNIVIDVVISSNQQTVSYWHECVSYCSTSISRLATTLANS